MGILKLHMISQDTVKLNCLNISERKLHCLFDFLQWVSLY